MNVYKKIIILLFVPCFAIRAQSLLFPVDYMFDLNRQRDALKDTSKNYPNHLSMQPFEFNIDAKADSIMYSYFDVTKVTRRLTYDNLIKLNVKDPRSGNATFKLTIDPVFNFSGGTDFSDRKHEVLYTNSRGIWAKGAINEKIKFESIFVENQSTFANYVDAVALSTGVVPGQGRYKTFKNNGYDYAFSSGVVSYSPSKNFNIQLGHGKQKVGNGYRSLLLSDNSFNYPFVRFTSKFFKGKLQYSNTYAVLMNMTDGGAKTPPGTERLFQKKAAAFQQLSWQVHKRINISFFQALIWSASDNNNRQHIDAEYLNPMIFTNAAVYGLNGKNNVLLGGDIQIKLFKSLALYGQLMLDDIDASSLKNSDGGFQVGMKYYDVFTIKNLFIQAEFNSLNQLPYTSAYPSQSYSHYNQNLAYPIVGYNGQEVVLIGAYNYKRIFANVKINIFESSTGFSKQDIMYTDAKAGYMINPKTNMNLSAGMTYRTNAATSSSTLFNSIFYLSFKTSLYNVYLDF